MLRERDPQSWHWKLRHYLLAILIVVIASSLRAEFFTDLGRGIPYLTYFHAVVLAAVFGSGARQGSCRLSHAANG